MEVLGKYPILPGVLVAGLTSASLSTVSSALNSMALIFVEDYVKWAKPNLSETQLAIASKIVSVVTGLIAFGLVFVITIVNKTIQIQPFATVFTGALYGPILGAFTVGMIFPWVNNIGALCGIVLSMLMAFTIGIGSILTGLNGQAFNQKLSLRTDGCNATAHGEGAAYLASHPAVKGSTPGYSWKDESSTFSRDIFNISYMWQPAMAAIAVMIISLLVSPLVTLIRNRKSPPRVNACLLSKPFLRLWTSVFGQEYMSRWVDFDLPHFGDRKSVPRKSSSEFRMKENRLIHDNNGLSHDNNGFGRDNNGYVTTETEGRFTTRF